LEFLPVGPPAHDDDLHIPARTPPTTYAPASRIDRHPPVERLRASRLG
jgi:hypothetical protein